MNILEAISDPQVFGPAFRNKATWQAWMAFLAALFGLPMTDEQLATYRACTARTEPPTAPMTEAWLVIGRRGGKSFMLALIAVFVAAFYDWRPYLGPGERATVMVIAADRRQARTILRFVKGLLHLVPMLQQLIEYERADAIDLACRVSIEIHTASFRVVRGYTIVAALLDELAFWRGEDSASPDTEVLNAIKPAMATIPNGMLLCASSPYARRGVLFEAFTRYWGQDGNVLVWRAPTRTMNPTVPQRLVDEALEADPQAASAEYMAQFRSDIENFISKEALGAVVNLKALERPALNGRKYVAFCDPSGGSNDSMTLAIAHKEDGLGVLDVIRERQAPFSPEACVFEFASVLKSYRITRIQGDRYSGEWCAEAFRRHGIRYDPADKPKSDLYRDLLPLINSGQVQLLNNKRLITQLTQLERRTARSGKDSIDHPPGAHDDMANACAGALVKALAAKQQACWGAIDFARSGRVTWHDQEPEPLRLKHVTVNSRGETIKEETRSYARDSKWFSR